MAPEHLEGQEADARTDLFAFGCVLYEMVTGKRAFQADSQASLIATILKDTPRPVLELQPVAPLALERIVSRCLEKDPEERFQSARDVAFALDGVASAGSVEPRPAGDRRHHPAAIAAKALVTVAIGGGLFAVGFLAADRLSSRTTAVPTFKRLTFQRGTITDARFTSDGKTVVYSAAWDGQAPELFDTGADGTGLPRSLNLSGASLLSVAGDGELAVKQEAEYHWAELGRLAVVSRSGTAPRAVLEDVRDADWSRGTNQLAVVRRLGGEDRLEMPPGTVLARTSGWFTDVRVSPDGRRVALSEHPVMGDARGTVLLVDVHDRKTTRTKESSDVTGLAWSPDGRDIWVSAAARGVRTGIEVATADDLGRSGALRSAAKFPLTSDLHDISPDGTVLVSFSRRQAGVRGRSPDSDERELGWVDFAFPADLSADGRTLLFVDGGGERWTELHRVSQVHDGLASGETRRRGRSRAVAGRPVGSRDPVRRPAAARPDSDGAG